MLRIAPSILAFSALISVFSVSFLAQAQQTSADPLYLSYEQRFGASLAVEIATAADPAARAKLVAGALKAAASYANPVQIVDVDSFEDFLTKWRGSWVDSFSLTYDVEQALKSHLPRRRSFRANAPALQSRIDAYIKGQIPRLKRLAHDAGLDAPFAVSTAMAILSGSPADALAQQGKKLIESQMARVDQISGELADQAFGGARDAAMKIVMRTVFQSYYSKLGDNSKKAILSGFLGSNLDAPKLEHFATLLQGSGPQLQKMIQTVARDGDVGPHVAAIFQRLEDQVKPVPFELVRPLLESEKTNYDIVSIEEKSLGVGTMAQVHRAVIKSEGRKIPVVLRFLKPGIEQRVEEDDRIFRQIAQDIDANPEARAAGAPRVSPLVDEVSNTVRAEEDLAATRRRQSEAVQAYMQSRRIQQAGQSTIIVNFKVPRVYEPRTPDSHLHVQELVSGTKFESVAEDFKVAYPKLRDTVSTAIAELWLKEALFGNGFYHSDLHQGNYLAEMRESEIDIHLLDYGMAGRLTRRMQDQILVLATAVEVHHADVIAKAFWDISNQQKNETEFAAFHAAIVAEMKAINEGRAPVRNLRQWTVFALDHGLSLPYDFVNINRGLMTIERAVQKSDAPQSLIALVARLAKAYPVRITKTLLDAGLPPSSLIKLGWDRAMIRLGSAKEQTAGADRPEPARAVRCEATFR